jgi:hypothetical protein
MDSIPAGNAFFNPDRASNGRQDRCSRYSNEVITVLVSGGWRPRRKMAAARVALWILARISKWSIRSVGRSRVHAQCA